MSTAKIVPARRDDDQGSAPPEERLADTALAMRNADAGERQKEEGEDQQDAIAKALAAGIAGKARTFNTHSQALAGRLIAEERALNEIVADIDAKLAELNEQRTDAMLAHSMISHALIAAQKGQAGA